MTARTSSASLFRAIVLENLIQIDLTSPDVDLLRRKISVAKTEDSILQYEYELMLSNQKLFKFVAITIVFSVMTIDAYIYDYAARNLSDTYVKKHIDRLDLISKWVVIPRLVTGKELPADGKWLSMLGNLIKQRNLIIHHKSSEWPVSSQYTKDYLKKIGASDELFLETARQSVHLFDLLSAEIVKLDPREFPWVEGHLIGNKN